MAETEDIDLDRVVWDQGYREEVKDRLRGLEGDGLFGWNSPEAPTVLSQDAFEANFTVAFQPIVDIAGGGVFAYEALVRGVNGGDPASFFRAIKAPDVYVFDKFCRTKAVKEAARLGLNSRLSLNVLPNAFCDAECGITQTVAVAQEIGFPPENLIFEITESEQLKNPQAIPPCLKREGGPPLRTAIDDFGDGYAGLALLIRFQPDFVKLDKTLVRDVDRNYVQQATIEGLMTICRDLDLRVIAEGVETEAESRTLRRLGIKLMQGYWFARPATGALPVPEVLETGEP